MATAEQTIKATQDTMILQAREIERLRSALVDTKHFFLGHFDDSCEECRRGLATIDAALKEAD